MVKFRRMNPKSSSHKRHREARSAVAIQPLRWIAAPLWGSQ